MASSKNSGMGALLHKPARMQDIHNIAGTEKEREIIVMVNDNSSTVQIPIRAY